MTHARPRWGATPLRDPHGAPRNARSAGGIRPRTMSVLTAGRPLASPLDSSRTDEVHRLAARLARAERSLARERRARARTRAIARAAVAALVRRDAILAVAGHAARTRLQVVLGWSKVLLVDGCAESDPVLARALTAIERNTLAHVKVLEQVPLR